MLCSHLRRGCQTPNPIAVVHPSPYVRKWCDPATLEFFETTTVAISFETRRRAPNPLEKHIRLVSSLLFCCCVCLVPAMSQYEGRKSSASSTDGFQENVWGSPSGHTCITKFRVGRDSYKSIFPNVEETLGKLDSGSRDTLQNLSGILVQVPDNELSDGCGKMYNFCPLF